MPPKHRLPLAVVEPRLRHHLAVPPRQLPRELPAEVSCFVLVILIKKNPPYAKYDLSTKGVKRNVSL